MAEGLNEPKEVYQRFRSFQGSNLVQMLLLLSGKDEKGNQVDVPRIPMSTAQFAKFRMEKAGEFPEWLQYKDVSDLVTYDNKDRSSNVQVILTVDNQGRITEKGAEVLGLYQPDAQLTSDRAIDLTDKDLYAQFSAAGSQAGVIEMPGDELTSEKLQRILLRHPNEVPEEFAEDEALTGEYLGWARKQTGRQDVMNAHLDDNTDKTKLRAFYVLRAVRDFRSNVYGWDNVDGSYGCLTGIAPEALSAPGKGAERIK